MKRKADDDPRFNDVKFIKTEKDANIDYSQDVKKKINSSARTGQACDRCRVSTYLPVLCYGVSTAEFHVSGSENAM